MSALKVIEKPKKVVVGETYMVNDIGWKKVVVIKVLDKKVSVQEPDKLGEPFLVDVDRIKVNFL